MDMLAKLVPNTCPCCGSMAETYEDQSQWQGYGIPCGVRCTNCGLSIQKDTLEEAVKCWDRCSNRKVCR